MKKVFIPILISVMLLGGLSAFAEKLDAPLASFDDLQTYSGVEFNKTEKNGEPVYETLDTSKEGSQEILKASIEENNRRIDKLWAENAMTKFAEKEKLEMEFTKADYGLVQFNCTLSDITVDELAKELRYQVVKKVDKERRTYYEYFTDRKWKDISQYHLAFDSSKFDQDTIVKMIKITSMTGCTLMLPMQKAAINYSVIARPAKDGRYLKQNKSLVIDSPQKRTAKAVLFY